jgi:tetratricopeptide (TPR) repeat protein
MRVIEGALHAAREHIDVGEDDAYDRARLVRAELALDMLRNGGRNSARIDALEHRLDAEQATLRAGCDAALVHLRDEIATTRRAARDDVGSALEPLIESYRRIATCHEDEGRRSEAAMVLTELIDTVTTAVEQGTASLDDASRRQVAEAFHARGQLVEAAHAVGNAAGDYEAALAWYDDMDQDPITAEAMMRLRLKLGNLYMVAGERQAAKLSYEALVSLNEQLAQGERSVTHDGWLRYAYGRLGEIAALEGDFSRARTHLERELEVAWSSLHRAPSDYGRRAVASVFLRLGRLEMELGKRDVARTRLFQGLSAILEMKDVHDVFDDERMKALLAEDLATYFGVLGELEQQDGNFNGARAHYEHALQLLRQRVDEDPNDVGSRLALADSLERLADLWMVIDEPDQAMVSLDLRVKLLSELLAKHDARDASRVHLVHRLARAHIDALHACLVQGTIEAGGAHLGAARALVDSLEPGQRKLLAKQHAELVDAIEEMEEVIALPIEGLRPNGP